MTDHDTTTTGGGDEHAHRHPLKPPITDGMTWRKCDTCGWFIHATCGMKNCVCDGKDRR